MVEVTLLVNLKTQEAGVVVKGTKFRGNLSELPGFVERMIQEERPGVCSVVELPSNDAVEELSEPRTKRKSSVKK